MNGNAIQDQSCFSLNFLFGNFAVLSARPSFSLYREEGKSGQQRATHRLTAGLIIDGGNTSNCETDSATENNRPYFTIGIRVKTCGKSARLLRVTVLVGKPCVL